MENFGLKTWIGGCLFLFLTSGCALQQSGFRAEQVDYRWAIVNGQVKEFLISMETQALKAEERDDWQNACDFYRWASRAAIIIGQLQKALTYANKAMETAERVGSPEVRVGAVAVLVSVHTALGQHVKAQDWAEKGVEITKLLPNGTFRETYEGVFHLYLGLHFLRQGNFQKAIEYLSYSLQVQEGRLNHLIRAGASQYVGNAQESVLSCLESLGSAYRNAGDFETAIAVLEKGITLIKRFGLKTDREGALHQRLGQTYLAKKNFLPALEEFTRALDLAEERHHATQIRFASTQIGEVLLKTHEPSEAIPYFEKAIGQIESTRSLIQSEEFRQSYFEGNLSAYVGVVDSLVSAGRSEEAFSYNERSRSRALLDLLGSKAILSRAKSGFFAEERTLQERIAAINARLSGDEGGAVVRTGLRTELAEAEKDYNSFLAKIRSQDKEQASLMSVDPLTLKGVQELLDPGQTLLEYFVTPEKTYLWVVDKANFSAHTIDVSQKDLSAKLNALRKAISEVKSLSEYESTGRELYDLLIRPALSDIKGKELIIVPHDVLHYLPFQALLAEDGKYLIEKYPISYLSSASLLQFVKDKRRAGGDKVLAFGNPDLGDPGKDLEYAELEAQEVKDVYPQSSVFVRKEATEDKSKTLSPNYDILHFATHAQLNEDDPLSSSVLLAKDNKDDGKLEVREIFRMDLHANLVVLSGCDTALGKLSTGDELVGLTRAFIYAGTPSVVASLWNVDDASTAQLMSSFYKNLKTMPKVEALRQAQLDLIRGAGRSDLLAKRGVGGIAKLGQTPSAQPSNAVSTSHPYFWAPFILVGDGK